MAQPIANILHQDTIRRLSGDGAFDRGKRYAAQGRVSEISRKDGAVTAKVRGSADSYDVRIWIHEGSLAYACNCPQGQEQAFCKHAVAVALSFVAASPSASGTPPTPPVQERAPATPPMLATTSPAPVAISTTPTATPAPLAVANTAPPITAPSAIAVEEPRAKTLHASIGIAASLRALSHGDLVTLILEEALEDDTFRARVLARLAR